MKPICVFTLAYGRPENLVWAGMMINSLKKFHPDIPVFIYTDQDIDPIDDPRKSVRMYARFGKELAKKYETVVQIDSDSIVTGNLDHVFTDKDVELACPLNNNLIDPRLSIHDIPHQLYVNAGFVMARGQRFWNWWDELNQRVYFNHYQFGEQDTLNMIFHYGDFKTKILDIDYGEGFYGLIHKGQWGKFKMKGNDIVLPKVKGLNDNQRKINLIHWAGGNTVKMNFHPFFSKDVIKRLEYLTADE